MAKPDKTPIHFYMQNKTVDILDKLAAKVTKETGMHISRSLVGEVCIILAKNIEFKDMQAGLHELRSGKN